MKISLDQEELTLLNSALEQEKNELINLPLSEIEFKDCKLSTWGPKGMLDCTVGGLDRYVEISFSIELAHSIVNGAYKFSEEKITKAKFRTLSIHSK